MPEAEANSSGAAEAEAIDAHAHVWTPDVRQYPLAPPFTIADMQPASFTAEELLKIARAEGVSRVVLIQMVFYGHDNTYLLDCLRRYPSVFSGVAQIDERGQDPAAEMRRLQAEGVRGVRITPLFSKDPRWLDHPGIHAMWECGAQTRMAMCPLINAADLPVVDQMCQKFPDTPVVIDHCARIGGDGPVREADLDKLCRLARHAHTHVKLSAFYYIGRKQPPYDGLAPMIRRLCDAYGPERLMWASDCPYQLEPPNTYAASLDLVKSRLDFLSISDKQWILRRTAETVFFAGNA